MSKPREFIKKIENPEEYFKREYGSDHIIAVIDMYDFKSLFCLIEEYAEVYHKSKVGSVKTEVVETENGHCVKLHIDHQSFKLEERTGEEKMTSYDHAKWCKKQLDTAFERLLNKRLWKKQKNF